jgi:hypothetical protein
MLFIVVSSLISGTIFAYILILLSSQALKSFSEVIKYRIDVSNLIIVILLGIFAPYFVSKKKLKASSIGILLAIAFYLIIN